MAVVRLAAICWAAHHERQLRVHLGHANILVTGTQDR